MLSHSPVVRSSAARALFLGSSAITVATLYGIQALRMSREPPPLTPIFQYLFVVLDYPGAVVSLLILGVAVFLRRPAWLRAMLEDIADHAVIIATVAAVLLCSGALIVYRNHPLSMDEYAPYFQSQVFASGTLTGRFPIDLLDWLIPPQFQDHFLNVSRANGEVVSAYWPSFALLLAPFTWLGIPWACNPLISAITLLVVRNLALQIFDSREAAGFAILMTIASPAFFADGISYYSMPAHMLANATYAALLARPTATKAALAGVVGSVALTLHNPVPHCLFALPWLFWVAGRKNGARLFGCLCIGYLPLCLLLGIGWFVLSSHLVHEHIGGAVEFASASVDSFARMRAAFSSPSNATLIARLIGVAKLWLWAVPGLVLIAGIGAWRYRYHPICRLLTVSALLTLLGYMFVPVDQGHGWGYRYFHSAWIALPILAAGAFTSAREPKADVRSFADDEMCAFAVNCALLTLVAGVGLRAIQIRQFISHQLEQTPAYSGSEPRVVIIDPRFSFYGEDLVQNDPWLRGSVIRMISHGFGADSEMMRRRYPRMHPVFIDRYGSVWSAAASSAADVTRVVPMR